MVTEVISTLHFYVSKYSTCTDIEYKYSSYCNNRQMQNRGVKHDLILFRSCFVQDTNLWKFYPDYLLKQHWGVLRSDPFVSTMSTHQNKVDKPFTSLERLHQGIHILHLVISSWFLLTGQFRKNEWNLMQSVYRKRLLCIQCCNRNGKKECSGVLIGSSVFCNLY